MSKLLVADPALLALPPLAPGESVAETGARHVEAITEAIPKMGPGYSLFGVHDIRGRGTHVEPSPHCDPFIMCQAVSLPAGMKPPFCAHPHCGASIVSILLQGTAMRPWDNVQGPEPEPLVPGGLYHVDTGAGCVHDEPVEPIALRPPTAPGFADEDDAILPATSPLVMMQLWWNAVDTDAPVGTPLRAVRTQVVSPTEVPRVSLEGGIHLRCLAGGYAGTKDTLAESATYPILLLHVRLEPQADGLLKELPSLFNGFLWVLEGSVLAGGAVAPADEGMANAAQATAGAHGFLRLPPGGDVLRLRNPSSDGRAMVMIGLGRPHRSPYYKYVGYGGGLIHRSVEEVQAAMDEYEADPKNFGRRAAKATGTAKDVDMSGYRLVPGFQSDGGEMMERPPEALARFAYCHKHKEDGPPRS